MKTDATLALIAQTLRDSIAVKERLCQEPHLSRIAQVAELFAQALRAGRKILLFGNGGSAADAQHIAAELVGRFAKSRRAYPALSLCVDPSAMTAISNDFGYEQVFARQLEALGQPGDVAVGLSTSGTSPNVVAAIRQAKRQGLRTVAFSGGEGGKLAAEAEVAILVPSAHTPRIQEAHITIGHILCALIDEQLTAA
ncbi:MAG: D-sedoheptulose 7-phosphate isomerase [Candidatus Omnitrophica bacterium]|nr:D-sedoheptulose 7-phosphate isomerase [Candidatus Omnitrophota bacterium]